MEITDPVLNTQGDWNVLCLFTCHLVADLHGHGNLQSEDHTELLRDSSAEICRSKDHSGGETLTGASGILSHMGDICIWHGQKMRGVDFVRFLQSNWDRDLRTGMDGCRISMIQP